MLTALIDDAAMFPPGLMPIGDAVPAHMCHRSSSYGGLVGPLVVAPHALSGLDLLLDPCHVLELTVVAPDGPQQLPAVLAAASELSVQLSSVEVTVPSRWSPDELFGALKCVSTGAIAVFIEIPRDERRFELIARCGRTPYRAKFRTGGTTADLYPDESELADAIVASVAAGVPFKATAGLHRAIRNTDPAKGFEQHGFLNVMAAVRKALEGAKAGELAAVLAERDPKRVVAELTDLDPASVTALRAQFLSFGSCSVSDPLLDLAELGLLPPVTAEDLHR
ncbi:MAG: hypothetical protein M1115_03705 [Actinobacteria bacterium]|nr:hypothetical protein [Actinomycetota bacterium]